MSFAKERARLSGAIMTYDRRPFVGWYREYASRRNGDKGHVSIDLLQREAWFNFMHCEDNFALVQRLLQMWNEPVYYGVQVIGYVLKKLDDLKKRHKDAESKTSFLARKGGAEIPSKSVPTQLILNPSIFIELYFFEHILLYQSSKS